MVSARRLAAAFAKIRAAYRYSTEKGAIRRAIIN